MKIKKLSVSINRGWWWWWRWHRWWGWRLRWRWNSQQRYFFHNNLFSVFIAIKYLRWQWWWWWWNPWSIWQRWWWWWRGWWWWSAKSINNKGKEQQWKWTMGNFGVWIFLWFNTVRLENSLGNKQESIPRTHLLIFKLVINFSIFEIYFFI